MSVEEAMNVLEKQKGRQFDPKLVEIFVDMIKNNRIELKLPEALEES